MSRQHHRPANAPTAAVLVAAIVDAAAEKCGVTAADIRGRRQNACHVWARQIAQALAVEYSGETNQIIGTMFGLDATTVHHAIRRVAQREREVPLVAAQLSDIRAIVEARVPNARWRSQAETARHQRMARADDHAELELDQLLRELRKGLMAALRADPGRLLAGLARAAADINEREARP